MTLTFPGVTRALTSNKPHITPHITLSVYLRLLPALQAQYIHVTPYAGANPSKYDRPGTRTP